MRLALGLALIALATFLAFKGQLVFERHMDKRYTVAEGDSIMDKIKLWSAVIVFVLLSGFVGVVVRYVIHG